MYPYDTAALCSWYEIFGVYFLPVPGLIRLFALYLQEPVLVMRSDSLRTLRNINTGHLLTHYIGRSCIIFQGTGKRTSQVEKAVWHPGVDVEAQGYALANSDYCNRWEPPSRGVLA